MWKKLLKIKEISVGIINDLLITLAVKKLVKKLTQDKSPHQTNIEKI
jgi:hypothetical protein